MSNQIKILSAAWLTPSSQGSLKTVSEFNFTGDHLGDLKHKMISDQSDKRWGRIDRFSKLGIITAAWAMKDANLKIDPADNAGVFISTSDGCNLADQNFYQTILDQDGLFASPNLFAYTLSNCMAGEISLRHQLTGPAMVISQQKNDLLNGIKTAMNFINFGTSNIAITGYCNAENNNNNPVGAILFVLQKTNDQPDLTFENNQIYHNNQNIETLSDLMRTLTCNP